MEKIIYFNSKEAAQILGVNVSTIKRWTDEGKLHCVKSSGGHRKFLVHHLAGFFTQNKKYASKATIFPVETIEDFQLSHYILKGDFNYLRKYVLDLAMYFERERLFKILQGLYLAQHPLPIIYDQFIYPILRKIGHLWETGEISVAEEHVASQNIRDLIIRLRAVSALPPSDKGTALCLTFSGDLHDIALKMADYLLETNHYKVLFSGQMTPALSIEELLKTFRPRLVILSSTYVEDVSATQQQLDVIKSFASNYGFKLFGGGRGFEKLDTESIQPLIRLPDFTSLQNVLSE